MSRTSGRCSTAWRETALSVVVCGVVVGGCSNGSAREGASAESGVPVRVIVGESPAGYYGPGVAPVEDEAAGPAPDGARAVAQGHDPGSVEGGPGVTPEWWFGEALVSGGRRSLCAAGYGRDLAGARNAAIEAGGRRLRGLGAVDDAATPRIDRVSVVPLPGAGRGGSRYIGFVMMSVEEGPGAGSGVLGGG